MISILSSNLLMATILIRLLSKYPLLRLVLDYDISERDQGTHHFQSFPPEEKSLLFMTGMINVIPKLKP